MNLKFWQRKPKLDPQPILETLLAALPIVQFGVANLDPAGVIWPYEKLRYFGECLRECPGVNIYMHELGSNLVEFAAEFKRLRSKYEMEHERAEISRAKAERELARGAKASEILGDLAAFTRTSNGEADTA